jgi:hypothetical protein
MEKLAAYVDSEFGYEWQRKSSFETRAFSIVAANLAMTTLFLALSDRLELLPLLREPPSSYLILAALSTSILSIGSGLIAAIPRDYPTPDADALEELFTELTEKQSKPQDLQEELLDVRLGQLRAAVNANDKKARYSIAAFTLMGIAAACLASALLAAR